MNYTKVFENIAEYRVFKKKYELMGELEEDRLLQASQDQGSLLLFFQFIDDVSLLGSDSTSLEIEREEKFQEEINRIKLFR